MSQFLEIFIYFYFVHMGVLTVYIYYISVHCICTWYLQSIEEHIRTSDTLKLE